ncbi:MAG: glycosyltransferase, partial [Caldilineaceae bacterium]
MEEKTPKVSIGLAVYNGEDYLSEAIESILNQSFSDFELIISDNASTDRTTAICEAYAAQDARIRYHRNETNIGGANNENLTMQMAR